MAPRPAPGSTTQVSEPISAFSVHSVQNSCCTLSPHIRASQTLHYLSTVHWTLAALSLSEIARFLCVFTCSPSIRPARARPCTPEPRGRHAKYLPTEYRNNSACCCDRHWDTENTQDTVWPWGMGEGRQQSSHPFNNPTGQVLFQLPFYRVTEAG